ncbi:hypothetical protein D1007_24639 [Hordeum vulgare]|nr:hypothetical protein D1007_24639 [Hordeum vulgare]
MMAWAEDEAIGPDVASGGGGLHVSERIGRDAAAQPDLEEALEAPRYASHPYSSHPKEVMQVPAFCTLKLGTTLNIPMVLENNFLFFSSEKRFDSVSFLEIRMP